MALFLVNGNRAKHVTATGSPTEDQICRSVPKSLRCEFWLSLGADLHHPAPPQGHQPNPIGPFSSALTIFPGLGYQLLPLNNLLTTREQFTSAPTILLCLHRTMVAVNNPEYPAVPIPPPIPRTGVTIFIGPDHPAVPKD